MEFLQRQVSVIQNKYRPNIYDIYFNLGLVGFIQAQLAAKIYLGWFIYNSFKNSGIGTCALQKFLLQKPGVYYAQAFCENIPANKLLHALDFKLIPNEDIMELLDSKPINTYKYDLTQTLE